MEGLIAACPSNGDGDDHEHGLMPDGTQADPIEIPEIGEAPDLFLAMETFKRVSKHEKVKVVSRLSFTRWETIGVAARQFHVGWPVHTAVLLRAAQGDRARVVQEEDTEYLLPAGTPDDQAAGMLAALKTREAYAHAAILADIMDVSPANTYIHTCSTYLTTLHMSNSDFACKPF